MPWVDTPRVWNTQVSIQSGSVLVTAARGLKAKTGHLQRLWGPGSDLRLSGGRGGRGWIRSVLQLPEP